MNNSIEKKIDVSFIIPTYNSSREEIERIFETFFNSTSRMCLLSWEIIVIDDGSTNQEARNLYNKYHEKISLKYIRQTNQGPAAARQKGIEEAKGEYISFIDSDDQIKPNFLEIISEYICQKKDVIIFPYFLETPYETISVFPRKYSIHDIILSLFFASYKGVSSYGGNEGWCGYLWRYLFKKEFLEKKKIKFNTLLKSGEDNCFMIDVFSNNASFVSANKAFYTYRLNLNSISRKITNPKIILEKDLLLIHELQIRSLQSIEKSLLTQKEAKQAMLCRISTFAFVSLQNAILQQWKLKECKEILTEYYSLGKKYKTKLNRKIKFLKRIFIFLFINKLFFFCFIMVFLFLRRSKKTS